MSQQNRFIEFREKVLNANSPSICAAKWNNATIWLYSGLTASCHHPPSHPIPLSELKDNPSALHNTQFKKSVRRQMQNGERPQECSYCWKIEDLGSEVVSDRVFHSLDADFDEVKKMKEDTALSNYQPKKLEIAFERTCQFACAYCNPSYSTTWVRDIQTNGPYQGLKTDQRDHFVHTHAQSDPYFQKSSNPYIDAFWSWWPEVKKTLKQLRVTGGEPLLSQHVWKLLELMKEEKSEICLALNSNLGLKTEVIEKLALLSHDLPHLEVYTSNEAFGPQAEYIRDGLDYSRWIQHLKLLKEKGNIKRLHVMMTINGLCLYSIHEFLEHMIELKKLYGPENPTLSMNIVRWPTFHSPLVMPQSVRKGAAQELANWLKKYETTGLILAYEKEHCERLIQYLNELDRGTDDFAPVVNLQKDLKKFILQYDQRRQKNFLQTFPSSAQKWFQEVVI